MQFNSHTFHKLPLQALASRVLHEVCSKSDGDHASVASATCGVESTELPQNLMGLWGDRQVLRSFVGGELEIDTRAEAGPYATEDR
jgi:hypothetical protein